MKFFSTTFPEYTGSSIRRMSDWVNEHESSFDPTDFVKMKRELYELARCRFVDGMVKLLTNDRECIEKDFNKVEMILLLRFLGNQRIGLREAKHIMDTVFEERKSILPNPINADKVPF